MKRERILLLPVLVLGACGEQPAVTDSSPDTALAEVLQMPPVASVGASGWKASIVTGADRKKTLVVSGVAKATGNTLRPKLTKKENAGAPDLNNLVLTLSSTPVHSGKTVPVIYKEVGHDLEGLRKVTIMYRDSTVAVIDSFE